MSDNTTTGPGFSLKTTNRAWADLLILAVILAFINLTTVGMADWGWMKLNPCPWLLIPLFLGARYGFGWGVLSGVLVAVMIYAGRAVFAIAHDDPLHPMPLAQIFSDSLYFFLILPGIGFLTGETQGLLSRKLAATEEKVSELNDKSQQLEAELDVAEESRFQLQEKLALYGAEHSSLDRQLRAMFEPTAGAIFSNLLRLLRDISSVTDAGIYALEGDNLKRIALLGSSGALPENLSLAESEIVRLAIERRALTTIREVWQEAPDPVTKHIAALPWLGGGGRVAAVLLIHRMHFLGTTWRNFHRIQMICRWVARYVDLRVQANSTTDKLAGNSGALIVTPRALEATLNQAEAVHREWRLPSTLATFEFTEPVTEQVANLLAPAVGSVMRPTDVGTLEGPPTQPVFKILMPMEGVDDAEGLLTAALAAIAKVPQLAGKVVGNLGMTDEGEATDPATRLPSP